MTTRRRRTLTGAILCVGLAALSAAPVRADTKSDLASARARLAAVQADLNRLANAYSAAETRLAQTQAQIDQVRARIGKVQSHMAAVRKLLSGRARAVYEAGGAGTIELLLTANSFSQFSDRVIYLGSVAQGDNDLLVEARVTGEELRRDRASLTRLSSQQAATIHELAGQKAAIADVFARQQALVGTLQRKLAAQEAAAARLAAAPGATVFSGRGALSACPVGSPRAFGDDFGAPRPGGRRHQGIDLLAPYGTPVFAAQSGRFSQNSNSLGGISALVFADNGDYTYYAHLSSYAGVPNGAHVAAGAMIGHVGNTGDAAGGPYHLHFEYHPGGGSAVDPYRLLVAVCG